MRKFRYIEDVENWLKPLGYENFWNEVRPYCLVIYSRDECDYSLSMGTVTMENLLPVLKDMAAMQFSKRHKLPRRPATPHLKVVEAH